MLNRRKFLKVFGFASLAFSLLPSIFVKGSFSKSLEEREATFRVRNWLYGSPRRGCSTPDFALEYHDNVKKGLKDFESFRIPPEFVFRISHEQYLS